MKCRLRVYIAAALTVSSCVSTSRAQFSSLETENLRLIYYSGMHAFLVPHVARCFENALGFHHDLWDYKSSEKVTVFLHDFNDYGNGGARAAPRNSVSIAIAPLNYVYETAPANERVNSTMNHELTHIVALDKSTGSDRFFRSLFAGKVTATSDNPLSIFYSYLTSPRRSAPRWYHEGIAVFLETWMAGGYGRALGPYDEMVFRTMVRDSSRIYDRLGLESEGTKVDFHVGVNSYLYGTRFFSYLAYQYGPESLIKWVSRSAGSNGYFASQFRSAYGVSLDDEWSRWIQWEQSFQQANLDSVRLYPTTEYRSISRRALGSVSRAFYDSTSSLLYAAVNYPGQIAHLAAIDINTGQIERICDIKGPALFYVSSLAYDCTADNLFYTTDNNDWRDLMVLDTKTRRTKMLLKDARVGDLALNPVDASIWGVRHFNGISTLVRIPFPYEEWNRVYSWPYGKDLYDLDVSPDGKRLAASLAEISGRQSLILMDTEALMAGDTSYVTLFDFGNTIPANFVFSADGKHLYGSSYYTGISNVFRYDFGLDSMEALSNCETGFFRPLPVSSDSLIVFRYTGKGFVPVMIGIQPLEDVSATKYLGQAIVERHPIVKDWMASSPASINLDSLTSYTGGYNGLANLRPVSAYPIVEGYQHFAAVGIRLNLSDAVGMHKSNVTVSCIPNDDVPADERWHADWRYSYLDWKIRAKYNGADFYDLFGPTKTSRKGYSLGLEYHRTLLYDVPKTMGYVIHATGYGGLERLPDYQNITTGFDKFLSFGAHLNYSNLRASLGAVDYEKGVEFKIVSGNTYVRERLFPRVHTSLGLGFPLAIPHSSIWLRLSTGYSWGDRDEPFANFYFGGFGNNWVDYSKVRRYREYYSFPGVELNDIGGTNYARTVVEWTLPPLRFRRLGVPTFYATWARISLFSSGIVANLDSEARRRTLADVGSQVDVRLVMLSHLNITVSAGYAVAFEEDQDVSEEFMFSVRIL